jgi:diadenosine tetraphosphatase ApaH/serine/threonine PP2A family protein phosphatase
VEAANVDALVVGGGALWGPFQSECLAALRSRDARFVAGNCERDVLTAVDESSAWCRGQLSPDELEFVARWPATIELRLDGLGSTVFCHASPRSDTENLARTTSDAEVAAALSGVSADVVVCGHTHVQDDRRVPDGPRLVNAGSVGMPFQGEAGAFWALLDSEVELRRTAYDVEAALAWLEDSGFPDAAGIFGESVRGLASAESATAYFQAQRG